MFPRFDPYWAMARICVAIANAFGGEARISNFYPVVSRRRKPRGVSPERMERAMDGAFRTGGRRRGQA